VLGDLNGLPPIVVHSASDDMLAQDSIALEARAAQAGAQLEHRRLDGVWHDVHLQAWMLSGIGDPIGELAASLRARGAAPCGVQSQPRRRK
jgi:monoterpene epsilon-lactone hydrolase